MDEKSRQFLFDLLRTPSPTGSEQRVQRIVRDRFKNVAHRIEGDVHGNLTLSLNPDAKPKIMLAGHCDQIGYLVKYISPAGYIYLDQLGGTDYGVTLGEHLVIHNRRGEVEGIVGRKPLHLQEGSEIQQIPAASKIWVDIGATNESEARERVDIGDYVTFKLNVTEFPNNLLVAPGLDNKAGLFICLEAFRLCAESRCTAALHCVSTVQEEIGSRGAATATSRLSPDVGIAVDTFPATDDPGFDMPPQRYAPCKLRAGPTISTGPNTNPVVRAMLIDVARQHDIPWQPDPSGKTAANDARVIQIADSGVAVASIGLPLRNMHTQVEMISTNDIDNAVKLLVALIQSIKPSTDLRPINFTG